MPRFHELMFEFSNEERMKILSATQTSQKNFSGLARDLEITTQEVSRHIGRLSNAGLVSRNVEGFPVLTPYGRILLGQMKSLRFVSTHSEYFKNHKVDTLPSIFTSRLGELSNLRHQDNVMVTVNNIIRILQEAEEYVLDLNVPYVSPAIPHIREAYERGIRGKFLHGRELTLPEEMKERMEESFTIEFSERMKQESPQEERYLETEVMLYMNEKEVAILCFPDLEGQYDFIGFTGSDPVAHRWCKDLFYNLWDIGSKVN